MKHATRELSKRTWPDFVEFFSNVHGCACTLYSFGRHVTLDGKNAAERARLYGALDRRKGVFPGQRARRQLELDAMHELVWTDRAHGILVYAGKEPVGWCQFGRVDELPVPTEYNIPQRMYARDPSSDWRITCFTTRMDHRGRGVATAALAAAIAAITRRGGGWVEALPVAFTHRDTELPKLRKAYGWRSEEIRRHLADWPTREIPGIGTVRASHLRGTSLGHSGTMSMFERHGFQPIRRDDSGDAMWWIPGDRVLMRRRL